MIEKSGLFLANTGTRRFRSMKRSNTPTRVTQFAIASRREDNWGVSEHEAVRAALNSIEPETTNYKVAVNARRSRQHGQPMHGSRAFAFSTRSTSGWSRSLCFSPAPDGRASIVGGLWRSLDSEDVVRFAFMLAPPSSLAAGVLKLPSFASDANAHIREQIVLCVILSGIAAYFGVRSHALVPDPDPHFLSHLLPRVQGAQPIAPRTVTVVAACPSAP
jgi:hypothetical protein